jgi:hypothetical protein
MPSSVKPPQGSQNGQQNLYPMAQFCSEASQFEVDRSKLAPPLRAVQM